MKPDAAIPSVTKSETVLRCAHAIACLLHATSTVTLWSLSSAQPITTLGIRVRWKSTDGSTTCDNEQCYIDPFIAKFSTLSLLEICAAFGIITALSHAVQTVWVVYTTRLAEGVCNPIRWAEYSITASLMFICIQLICGIYDESAIWIGAVSMWGIIATGGVTEYMYAIAPHTSNASIKEDALRAPGALTVFAIQAAVYFFMWITLFDTLIDVNRDPETDNKMPNVVYIIIGAMFLIYSCFMFVFYWSSIRNMKVWNTQLNVARCELIYIAASLTSKLLLHWFLWSSTLNQDDMVNRNENGPVQQLPRDGDYVRNRTLIIGGVVAAVGIMFAVVTTYILGRVEKKYN